MTPPASVPGPPRFVDRFDLFVFDLDGTLADTRQDLAESVNHALERLGKPRRDLLEVTRFIGNGATVLLERALGSEATQDLVRKGLQLFLEHYGEHCLGQTRLYPDVERTARALRDAGKTLCCLTNKPAAMSRKILFALGIGTLFERIDGGDSFPVKKPDPVGLHEYRRLYGISPERTLMIGDSAVDVATARSGGAAAAGVLWGFKPEEFETEKPDFVLRSMGDLLGLAQK